MVINESWHLIRPSLPPRNGYFIKFTDSHIGTCKYAAANIGKGEAGTGWVGGRVLWVRMRWALWVKEGVMGEDGSCR